MIKIVDYGMGNLRSVQKALQHLGHTAEICERPEDVAGADRLILPGVGAFRDAIERLESQSWIEPMREHIVGGKPFLGICLGMQLLLDKSYEDGEYDGLGFVPGEVVRFEEQSDLKIPHMGWNRIRIDRESPLLSGLPDEPHVYFVHSYHVVPSRESVIVGTTDHGSRFVSVIQHENIFATQFHPEKSQAIGLKMLDNFATVS